MEVYVDANSFQIPLVQQLVENAQRRSGLSSGRDLRQPYPSTQPEPHFKYSAGGIMPDDMLAMKRSNR